MKADADYLRGMAELGRSVRFSLRRMARAAGLKTMPGSTIYVGGDPIVRADASLNWEPGEEEWNRANPVTK
jgi:hypothetical protein